MCDAGRPMAGVGGDRLLRRLRRRGHRGRAFARFEHGELGWLGVRSIGDGGAGGRAESARRRNSARRWSSGVGGSRRLDAAQEGRLRVAALHSASNLVALVRMLATTPDQITARFGPRLAALVGRHRRGHRSRLLHRRRPEFVVAPIGAVLLTVRRKPDPTPVWIALVAVHLFPAPRRHGVPVPRRVLLHYPLLHVVATLVTIAALGAAPLWVRSVTVNAITGLPVGITLLVAALVAMARPPTGGSTLNGSTASTCWASTGVGGQAPSSSTRIVLRSVPIARTSALLNTATCAAAAAGRRRAAVGCLRTACPDLSPHMRVGRDVGGVPRGHPRARSPFKAAGDGPPRRSLCPGTPLRRQVVFSRKHFNEQARGGPRDGRQPAAGVGPGPGGGTQHRHRRARSRDRGDDHPFRPSGRAPR
jgi:hypothetical protein